MKTETFTEKGFARLTPEDDNNFLTNGQVIAKIVCQPLGQEGDWRECSPEEAAEIQAASETDPETIIPQAN